MMKQFLIFCLILILSACGSSTTGGGYYGHTNVPAENAPRQLNKTSIEQSSQSGPVQTTQTQNPVYGLNTQTIENVPQEQGDAEYAFNTTDSFRGEAPVAAPVSLPPVKVGILLPLSGASKDIGEAMLQAAQLAVFDMGYDSFELVPRDTKGTPEGARIAATSAVNEGVELILGPLFANSVKAVAPITRRARINTIAFSTDWTLAGDNIFIMGFLPFAQVQHIAEYAQAQGYRNIGILAPNNDYGNAVIAAYNSLAYRNGFASAEVTRFAENSTDLNTIVRQFARYDQRMAVKNQQKAVLEARLKANPNDYEAQRELSLLDRSDAGGPAPYDAVLIPAGGDLAKSISSMLSFYELGPDKVVRLGTGLWDDPRLASEPSLQGALFAAPSADLRREFESKYRQLFTTRPLRLATLAYDATALAAVLARNGYQHSGRPAFDKQSLINPNGFAGIDGIFRFRQDGLVERGLAILEFNNSRIEVIQQPPATFQVGRKRY